MESKNWGLILTTNKGEFYRIAEPDGNIIKLADSIDSEFGLNSYLIGEHDVLFSTKKNVYVLKNDDQIKPLGDLEIGNAQELIIDSNKEIAVIGSEKGLFIWDNNKERVREVEMITEQVDFLGKTGRGFLIRSKGTNYFLADNQLEGQPNILRYTDANNGKASGYKIYGVEDWNGRTLVVTDKAVLIVSDGYDEQYSVSIPGLEFGASVDSMLEFRTSNGRFMLRHGNSLYYATIDTLPKDNELDIDEPNRGETEFTLKWHINIEDHPCMQTEETFKSSIRLVTGDNDDLKPISIQPDWSKVNKLYFRTIFDRPESSMEKVVIEIKALEAKKEYEKPLPPQPAFDVLLNNPEIGLKRVIILYLVVFLGVIFCARYWNWAFRLLLNEELKYVNFFRLLVIYFSFPRRWVLARYFHEMKGKFDERDKNCSETPEHLNVVLEDDNGRNVRPQDILSLPTDYGEVLVMLNEGAGKTSLLHTLQRQYASEASFRKAWRRYKFLPIFIYLENYPTPGNTKNWIVELAQREFKTLKLEIRDLDYFQRILESGDFAIFLDGIDEIDIEHIEDALGYCGDTATVRDFITTRPLDKKIKYKKDFFKEFYMISQ